MVRRDEGIIRRHADKGDPLFKTAIATFSGCRFLGAKQRPRIKCHGGLATKTASSSAAGRAVVQQVSGQEAHLQGSSLSPAWGKWAKM